MQHNRGIAYAASGKYDEAIADYSDAIRIRPDYANAINNRGIAYQNAGDRSKAIKDYCKTLQIDSKHPQANENLNALLAESER